MVNFEELDKEKIAEAERLLRGKANTLGKDRPVSNESFARTHNYVPLDAVMTRTPTAEGGLIPPDYDDIPVVAALGTRHEEVRLHSYLPSGLTGPSSVQSFIVVSSKPDSHNFSDIEAVRIKHLISPKYSQGKANAAHPEPFVRGFELALFPAKSSSGIGSALVADTDNPISPVADPSSASLAPGAGTSGYWYVDYENGIVRFSHPPLNGSGGVMNPNNVYGDIEGTEVSDAYGAITMFATFYQYTGEYGTIENLQFVTVGDGYVSDGVFTGQSHDTVQAAINSLPENGGTVFIKEGTYDFVKKVTIPQNVNVVGLGGVKIIRPTDEAAFAIYDGYVTLEGVEIQPRRESVVVSGGCIELGGSQTGEEIKYVNIRNNVLYGQDDAPAIAFASEFDCTYKFLKITNNQFEQGTDPLTGGNIYIGGKALGGFVSLSDCEISHNTFSTLNGIGQIDYAIRLTSSFISTSDGINGLHITDNMMRLMIISIGDLSMPEIYNVKISDNTCRSIEIRTDYAEHLIIQSNTVAEHFSQSWIQINCDDFYELRIDNNYVEESIYIDPNSGTEVFIYFGTISNNDVENSIDIDDTDEGSEIDDMSITGNTTFFLNLPKLWATSVASNRAGDINICTSLVTSNVMRYSSIVGNQLYTGDLIINNSAATGSTSTVTFSSIISGNTGISLQIYGRVSEQVAISSNSFFGSAEFVQIGQSFSDPVAIGSNQFGSFEVSGNIDNADISGNAVRFVSVTGTITNTNFSNNQFDGSATFTGALSDTAFNSNVNISSFGTLTMPGGLTRCKLTDNVYRGTINISINPGDGDISGTIFSGNTFSTVTIGDSATNSSGNFVESKFLDGYILTSLTFNSIMTNSEVGGNLVLGALNLSANSTITRSNLFGNRSTSFAFGNVYDSKVSDNATFGTTTIAPTGPVQGSAFSNNTFGNTTITGDFTDSKFIDGYCVGSLTLSGIIVNGDISNNRITTSTSLGSVITNSQIANNIIGTTLTLGGISESKVKSNINNGTVTIAASGPLQGTAFYDNTFGGDTTITGACEEVQILDGYIIGSLTISNRFVNSKLDGNRITGGITIASSNTINNSTINNNIIGNNTLTGSDFNIGSGGFFNKSEFNSNVILAEESSGDTITFGDINQSSVASNKMTRTSINYSTITDSVVSGNICDSLFGGNITGSTLNNNEILLDFSVFGEGIFRKSVFSSNYVASFIAIGHIDSSSVIDSYCGGHFTVQPSGLDIFGAVLNSNISGNTIIGPATFNALSVSNELAFLNSEFSNNHCLNRLFIGTSASGTVRVAQNLKLSNNIFGQYFEGITEPMDGSIVFGNETFPTSTTSLFNVTIDGNIVISAELSESLAVYGQMFQCRISDNIFYCGVDLDNLVGTEISNNQIGVSDNRPFTSGYIEDGMISNNIFGGVVTFGNTSLTDTMIQSVVNGNLFKSNLNFAETNSGCYAVVFSDNCCMDDIQMCGAWFRCVISDNIHEGSNWSIGTTSTNEGVSETVISGNQSEFGLLSHSLFDEVTFTNNRMTSFEIDIDATSTLSRCADQTSFTGNFIEGTMTFDFNRAGGSQILNACTISGNSVGNIVIDSVHTAGVLHMCNISGNVLPNSGITISGTGGITVHRSVIGSNQMAGALSINNTGTGTDVLSDSIISDNIITSGNMTLGAGVNGTDAVVVLNNTHVTGNRIAGGSIAISLSGRDVEALTTTNSVISDNFISSDITIYGLTFESVMNGNIFTSLRFHTLSESIFSNNSLDGGVFSIVDDGYGIIADTNFSDNNIAGSINLIQNNLGGAPDAHVTVLVRSKFTGNDVGGSAYFIQQTANQYQSALDQTIMSGNKFSGNVQMQIRGSGTVLAPLEDITVINSSIDNNIILGELRILVFKDDGFGPDTFHTAIMVNSTIRDNIIMSNVFITNMGGSVSALALDNCIISGNLIGNETTGAPGGGASLYINQNLNPASPGQVVRDTIFSNNRIFGDINIGNSTAGFTFTNGDVVDSVFANNDLRHSDSNFGFINAGDLSVVAISGNVMNGLRFDTFAQTLISGNDINVGVNATGSAGVQLNSITGNYIFDMTFTGVPTGTWFVGNRISSLVTGGYSSNTIIGNRLDTGIDGASISTCTIIGNIMGAFANLGSISTSAIIGNTATNLAISNGTGSAILLNDVIVMGNRFSSAFTIAHTATGTGATMSESLIALNVFNGTLTLGSTGASFDHAFIKSGFIGNSGGGGLTLRTNVDTNLTTLIILGNAMAAFTYTNTATTNITVPSTTASVDFYMAFNYFTSHTRVTWTANIAWITSNVKAPGAAPTGGAGTNVAV